MNPVYLRLAFYSVSALLAAIGLAKFDAQAGTLTLNIDTVSSAIAGALAANMAVFKIWGKK